MNPSGGIGRRRGVIYALLAALLVLIVVLNALFFLYLKQPETPTASPTALPTQHDLTATVPVPVSASAPPVETARPTPPIGQVTAPPTPRRPTMVTLTPTGSPAPSPSPTATATSRPTVSPSASPTSTALPTATATGTPATTRTPGPISPNLSTVVVEPAGNELRWRITIRLIDVNGQPAAGVQPLISFLPITQPAIVEPPPPSDANGYAVAYISSSQAGCVTIEVRAGNVVLEAKPQLCFR